MPTFSLAQIFLTLWLFAAVVPAASVLFHGTLELFAPAHSERTGEFRDADASKEASAARQALPEASHSAHRKFASISPKQFVLKTGETVLEIAAPSLLHTELQRHRPRLA